MWAFFQTLDQFLFPYTGANPKKKQTCHGIEKERINIPFSFECWQKVSSVIVMSLITEVIPKSIHILQKIVGKF